MLLAEELLERASYAPTSAVRETTGRTSMCPMRADGSFAAHSSAGSGGPAPEKPLLKKLVSGVRGLFVGGMGALRPPPPASAVHIATAADYGTDLATILRQQLLDGIDRRLAGVIDLATAGH